MLIQTSGFEHLPERIAILPAVAEDAKVILDLKLSGKRKVMCYHTLKVRDSNQLRRLVDANVEDMHRSRFFIV